MAAGAGTAGVDVFDDDREGAAWTVTTLWSAAPPDQAARLAAELSYGLDVPGGGGALTPYAALTLAENDARTVRLGGRLGLDSGLTLGLEATHAEHPGTARRSTPSP